LFTRTEFHNVSSSRKICAINAEFLRAVCHLKVFRPNQTTCNAVNLHFDFSALCQFEYQCGVVFGWVRISTQLGFELTIWCVGVVVGREVLGCSPDTTTKCTEVDLTWTPIALVKRAPVLTYFINWGAFKAC
jgi:hypothetical protein